MGKSIGAQPATGVVRSRASWIWMAGHRKAINCHLLFRREFKLAAVPSQAILSIAASDQYRLYVNGRLVGDGPARSEIPTAYVDRYDQAATKFRKGVNCIAVLAHNTMMPQHGQSLVPGGLWVDVACCDKAGRRTTVRSDTSWRVTVAPQFAKPAPRRFFAVGFNEKIDFASELSRWNEAGFDDSSWAKATKVDDRHYRRLIERPIPLLRFEPWKPVKVRRSGTVGPLNGVWGLAFDRCHSVPAGREAVFGTWLYSRRAQAVTVNFGCDNWARVRLNGDLVWEQGRPDSGFTNHLEYDLDKYDGMVCGNGHRHEPGGSRKAYAGGEAGVRLKRGWNRLTVWMWKPKMVYGFEGTFLDRKANVPVATVCSAAKDISTPDTWVLLSDEQAAVESGRAVTTVPGDMRPWLEPSHLADWDRQTVARGRPSGVASLLAGAKGRGGMKLPEHGFVEFQLPADGAGFIDLELRGPKGAIVDVSIGEAQTADGRLRVLYNGLWQTDRLVLDGRWNRWLSLDRRAGRYLCVCVRQSSAPVEIRRLELRSQHYPVARLGRFKCDDWVLTRMWQVGAATVDAATFDVGEDCPTREKAQWGGDMYLRIFEIAYLWGDLRLSAKALREFAEDQKPDRWSRPMVPSGYGDKLVEYCHLLAPWAWYHYRFTGDLEVVRDTFGGVKNLMSYTESLADRRGLARQGDPVRNILYIDYTMRPYPRCGDTIGVLQCAYVMALDYGARLADLLGESALADSWRTRAEDLREKVRQLFWVEREGLFADGIRDGKPGGTFSAPTNYWMLLTDIPTAEQERRMLGRLWKSPTRENMELWSRGESPYTKFFMSEALLERGLWREAFASWRDYYGSMLRHPEAWSAFESWARGMSLKTPRSGNSLVHPFAIGPMAHLGSHVSGVRPLGPGFAGLVWQPMPGDLKWMKVELPLIGRSDTVRVEMSTRPGGGRRLVLTAPKGLRVQADSAYLAADDEMVVRRGRA
ncbi:MAG: alpha-L-rhamnosidase N-terminal domain-containing protein [Planctomycetes bacterium]|nr:alpha-L-rhamnosidase N-terminal domain-containing protein [Planctomycetota bacterium]